MKRLLLATLAVLAFAAISRAQYVKILSAAEQSGKIITSGVTSTTSANKTFPGATVTVYSPSGSGTVATLFSTSAGVSKANPFSASLTDATIDFFIAPGSTFDIRISGTSGGVSITPFTRSGYTAPGTQGVSLALCGGTADTSLLAALSALGGTIEIPRSITCASNSQTISAALQVDNGGLLKPLTGQTVTLTGPQIGGAWQRFTNALAAQGTISLAGNQNLTAIFPQWWGAKADSPTTDNLAMFTATLAAWRTASATSNPPEIQFPPGTYKYSVGLNWFAANLTMRALGQVTMKCTASTGYVMGFDAGSVNGYRVHLVGDWMLDGSGTTPTGLYTRNVHHSDFSIKARNITTAGLSTEGAVVNNYTVIVTSAGDSAVTLQPLHGVTVDRSAQVSSTIDCSFNIIAEYTTGTGVVLTTAVGNRFYGTSESTGGFGVTISSDSIFNSFINFDCEDNALGDYQVTGNGNSFKNCISISKLATTITGTTNAATAVISTSPVAHGLTTGQLAVLDGYSGALGTALNGIQTVTVLSSTTFSVPVNTTASGPFVLGPDVFGVGVQVKAGAQQNMWEGGEFGAAVVEATANSNSFWGYLSSYKLFDFGSNRAKWGKDVAVSGAILPPTQANFTVENFLIQNEGAALAISSNTITPTSNLHQVGAGLIKTITVPSIVGFPTTTGITIALIPTAAFTYDATGNILGTGTATIGRTMFATYSMSTNRWSMSY